MKRPDKLAMKQIERRLKNLRSIAKDTNVRTGWIAYMRQVMSMTLITLAKATGLSVVSIHIIQLSPVFQVDAFVLPNARA